MSLKFGRVLLLTGAGFTHNFGGYLGRDFYGFVHNDPMVRGSDKFRRLMSRHLRTSDFEAAYAEVMASSEFDEPEKSVFDQLILRCYQDLHRELDYGTGSRARFPYPNLNALIQIFNRAGEKNFVFTLNQDLFFESRFSWLSPGAPNLADVFKSVSLSRFDRDHFKTLPADLSVDDVWSAIQGHVGPSYLKLHGSYGWLSSAGRHTLVLGRDKHRQIPKEPLLQAYFQVFREVLCKHAPLKIIVIGYSFHDDHVNQVLIESVDSGSRLFIVNPSNRFDFEEELGARLPALRAAVECYYEYDLAGIFGNLDSPIWLRIKDELESW